MLTLVTETASLCNLWLWHWR